MAAWPYESDVGTPSINELIALARSSGIGFSVSSAYRAGDPGFHGSQNAVDLVTSSADMNRLAAYLYQYSPYLLELIHSDYSGPDNGGWFVKRGQRGWAYSASVVSDHYNHVHLASTISALRAASQGDKVILAGQTVKAGATAAVGCLPTVVLTTLPLIGSFTWLMHH